MLGAISTVAAIALAHAVVRTPASKEDGWRLNMPTAALYLGDGTSTNQPIISTASYATTTASPQYAPATQALDRVEMLQAQLEAYKTLPTSVDGEGIDLADVACIDAASQILSLLPAGIPLPKPMLSTDGEIGLYWKSSDYLADVVIEDANHFSLFIRSLKDGNREVFIPSIAIGPSAPAVIADAFQAA
jgi:hypothetical protein